MQRLQRLDTGELGMTRARSVVGAIAAVAVAMASAVVLTPTGASAQPRDPLVVPADGGEAVVTHPGIPGNNPSSQEVDPTPADCAEAADGAAFTVACDVIPLKVLVPNVSEADDFIMEISLTWEPADEVEGVGGVNDLDMYLYDNQQVAKRDDPESTTYTQFGRSTNFAPPELIRVYRPELGDYNLVINNFSGPNVSYTVKARLIIGTFEAPFEALAPTGSLSPPDDSSGEQPGPVDHSADEPTSVGFSAPPAPVAVPVLGEIAVLPDQDFSEFDSSSPFDAQLRQPVQAVPAGSISLRPPRPVPVPVLLFWFLIVPLAVLGPGLFFLTRRTRSRLGGVA